MKYYTVDIMEKGLYINVHDGEYHLAIGPFDTNAFIKECEQSRCEFAATDVAIVTALLPTKTELKVVK